MNSNTLSQPGIKGTHWKKATWNQRYRVFPSTETYWHLLWAASWKYRDEQDRHSFIPAFTEHIVQSSGRNTDQELMTG